MHLFDLNFHFPIIQFNLCYQNILIILAKFCLKKLEKLGRNFPWSLPGCCPCCNGKIQKHGFANVWFAGFDKMLPLRQLYCQDCNTTFRIRPDTHFPRFQFSIKEIKAALNFRLQRYKWQKRISKLTQVSWKRRLKKQIKFDYVSNRSKKLMEMFERLIYSNIVPVSRVQNVRIDPRLCSSN